jgi:hypothetical protein
MAKTRRVKNKRFYGGNQYGPDTTELNRRLQNIRGGKLDLTALNITSLPPLPNTVRWLSASNTPITSLPALPPNIGYLNVDDTPVTSLPALPPNLHSLYAVNTQLTSLPELPNTLQILGVSNTRLTSLPALPQSLHLLFAGNTRLTSLPELPPNLHLLFADHTPITSLPELPPNLQDLNVEGTPITSLPELPPTLRHLKVDHTRITSLPEIPQSLLILSVEGTPIPRKRAGETSEQYNTRVKARDLSTAQRTLFQPGTTAPPGSALQRVMDSNILPTMLTEVITGKKAPYRNVQPGVPTVSPPTAMQTLKKEATGSYNGGRTKKNKRV